MEYIDIEKELIPYRFDISLAEEMFTFEVHYNADHDFFTLDLERDGEVIAVGEKLVYGMPLFIDTWDRRYPGVTLIPLDESGIYSAVTWDTLSKSVFLYIWEEDDAE
ncbi:hypothetical protein PAECIP111893_00261 [Paenibacillus plantiphilus]|uniref:Cyanophage baseplate Pam3 plug gp18 domain-containing protein n=1 Tax=Paenibacillus plantiphilus TaxID=2905650 RepID=A0ABN8FUM3_9BACL|nr:hypothetical protein [Paenibacillus plantiphilus]CAH1190294.1 hypothetical protein PAECIP111893_00261 [Paenibacillus plantiphilus]